MPSLSVRMDLSSGRRIGPGKVELLEQIAAFGSIAGGARRMHMSYKRAWELINDMNETFGAPVITAAAGGRRGGGAQLTPLGLAVVSRFRAIERAANEAATTHLSALEAEIFRS